MSKKRCLVYLRISTERQSNFSIDGQKMNTMSWCERNNAEVIDTFIDEGYSARNFDRPDFTRLTEFIQQHYRTVDFLVINSFDRFSRDAGEAIVAIKKLQRKFAIKVVSVTEGVTFDADDPGSFFYAGLMLLKGEDEIIRNRSRINLGIYTAKKKEGRYLGAAPYGYKNAKDERNKPIIVPNEATQHIVKYIFESFLRNIPLNEIGRGARAMGYSQGSNSAITRILANRVYIGQVHLNAYKDNPDEWVEGIHKPLVDVFDFYQVQEMLSGRKQPHIEVRDDLPLRGVLKCHCGILLTGAPSRGRHGNYYLYYKCKTAGHNNISAVIAHEKLERVWRLLSVPEEIVTAIKRESAQLLEDRQKQNVKLYKQKALLYDQAQADLESTEQKWVRNQLTFESYNRLYSEFTNQRQALKVQMDRLSADQNHIWYLLQEELEMVTDMHYIYKTATTLNKQEMIRRVFDRGLYYKQNIYRTPSLIEIFLHNELILKQEQLLIIDKKNGISQEIPSGGAGGSRTRVQT